MNMKAKINVVKEHRIEFWWDKWYTKESEEDNMSFYTMCIDINY